MSKIYNKLKLRHADLRGKELVGLDFSHTDIRGLDFSGANLTESNFRGAKAGLPRFWVKLLVFIVATLAFLAGLISAYSGSIFGFLVISESIGIRIFGFISTLTLSSSLALIFFRGIGVSQAVFLECAAAATITAIALLPQNIIIGPVFSALALVGAMGGVGNIAISTTISRIISLPRRRGILFLSTLFGVFIGMFFSVRQGGSFLIAILVTAFILLIGYYVGIKAVSGGEKYHIIKLVSQSLVAIGGTKFCYSDLTDADFSAAELNHTDFSHAKLVRTCWHQVTGLENSRVEQTYLENERIFELEALVAIKDNELIDYKDRLDKIVSEVISQHRIVHTDKYIEGDLKMSESKGNININRNDGSISGVVSATDKASLTDIGFENTSANVSRIINNLPNDSESQANEIKSLLDRLQKAIETDKTLSNDDKKEALRQIIKLAEASNAPDEGAMKAIAKNVIRFFKGLSSELPEKVELVKSLVELLPLIASYFSI